MMEKDLSRRIRLIEEMARVRNDPIVPRDYILDTLEKIENGEIEVQRYPSGIPSLREVYSVALELYKKDWSKTN